MRITFPRAGNVYLNAGIVGIHVMLDEYDELRELSRPVLPELPAHDYGWDETANALWVETERPKELFERLYQLMGRKYYNTSTQDALNNPTNFYYLPDEDGFEPFPKMKTYGFGALLTNDAAGKTPNPDNTIRRKSIKAGDEFGERLLRRYEEHFAEQNLKLGQQLYVNEPYAKLTRLELDDKDFREGKYVCPVDGASYGRLHPATNVSPTTSGMTNFLSGLSTKGDKIGWKALYAVRFAQVLALYRYAGGLDTLYCYFYDHPRLATLYDIFCDLRSSLYVDDLAKQAINHRNNIQLKALDLGGKKNATVPGSDFVHPNEVLFQLVDTLTDALYKRATDARGEQAVEDEPGISLYLLRADKFAGTMRPNTFTAFNHFNYLRRYLRASREFGVNWGYVLASLRIHLPGKERDWAKERLPREAVIKKIISGGSFLEEIKAVFLGGYALKLSGQYAGYKRWGDLARLVRFNYFGPLNNYTDVEKEFHENAYRLGTQIGQAILNDKDSGDTPGERAKFGRKYVIDLDKSRTLEDLLEALKRIQLRYHTTFKKDLLLDPRMKDDFRTVKLLATIAALNSINGKLYLSSNNEDKKD